MVSQATIPMSISRDIRVLHLESTDVCQAACPSCAREIDGEFDATQKNHLTIQQILKQIDSGAIRRLDKMFMCGNYGDPAAGKHTLDIYRYFRKINTKIILGMNSNGAEQNAAWWQSLGAIFHQEKDYVVFSIDGLEDTNHIYRRGVDWHKLIENACAYIGTGARAHWDMLIYRHNEHQVDACQQLALDLGFSWFRAKVSKRPLVDTLQAPIHWSAPAHHKNHIDCHALKEQSVYIDAKGRKSPCCWLGSRQSGFIPDIAEVMSTWNSPRPNATCLSSCGRESTKSNFVSQWRREVQLC